MPAYSVQLTPYSNENYDEDVQYHFNKKFQFFRSEEEWHCVSPDKMFKSGPWQVAHMVKLKNDLNAMKNKLNDFNLEKWHQHTKTTNLSGNIIPYLKKNIKPEFVTQAWCKFYEICATYPIISKAAVDLKSLNTVHLCEAPGAFITALNHYLKSHHRMIKWDWLATTFNPHYEENDVSVMINDDRFLLLTRDHWKFGADQTGDLMNIDNFKHLIAESRKLGPVLLVTADGSFDCQSRPDEQEATVAPLVFCEIVAALHILSIGGSFVFKVFTMYEHLTICLMYLLNCCFEAVHVCKPAASKEGNSESYVVCINYDGTDKIKTWLRKLRQVYESSDISSFCIFPLTSIPESFMEQQLRCCELFKSYQEDVLERNIMNYVIDFTSGPEKYRILRQKVCEVFIKKCKIKPLESEDEEIVGKYKLTRVKPLQLDSRYEEGTFNEKINYDNLPLKEKLVKVLNRIQGISLLKSSESACKFPPTLPSVCIEKAKPVNAVKSSKFCSGQIIKFRSEINALMENAKVERIKTADALTSSLSTDFKATINQKYPSVLTQHCVQFNFGGMLWLDAFGCTFNKSERAAVLSIINALENAWRDSNFIIEGFPVLTQYSAGFIFILGHLFKEVHFIWPEDGRVSHGILFCGFKSSNPAIKAFMSDLASEAAESNEELQSSIHSIIPIQQLVENNVFYEAVVSYNMMVIKNQLLRDGKLIEMALKSYDTASDGM